MMNVLHAAAISALLLLTVESCHKTNTSEPNPAPQPPASKDTFYFGADLSYVNQILDHGGVYKDQSEIRSPYRIFKDHGATLSRFRLWHNPLWTKEVYGTSGTQLYNDLVDVEKHQACKRTGYGSC